MKPSASAATAVSETLDPVATKAPEAGAVSETVGATPTGGTTVKAAVVESTVAPSLATARANRVWGPAGAVTV